MGKNRKVTILFLNVKFNSSNFHFKILKFRNKCVYRIKFRLTTEHFSNEKSAQTKNLKKPFYSNTIVS